MRYYISDSVSYAHAYDNETSLWTEQGVYTLSSVAERILRLVNEGKEDIVDIVLNVINEFNIDDEFEAIKDLIEKSFVTTSFLTTKESHRKIKFYGELHKKIPRILHIELTNSCNAVYDGLS